VATSEGRRDFERVVHVVVVVDVVVVVVDVTTRKLEEMTISSLGGHSNNT